MHFSLLHIWGIPEHWEWSCEANFPFNRENVDCHSNRCFSNLAETWQWYICTSVGKRDIPCERTNLDLVLLTVGGHLAFFFWLSENMILLHCTVDKYFREHICAASSFDFECREGWKACELVKKLGVEFQNGSSSFRWANVWYKYLDWTLVSDFNLKFKKCYPQLTLYPNNNE